MERCNFCHNPTFFHVLFITWAFNYCYTLKYNHKCHDQKSLEVEKDDQESYKWYHVIQ